MLMLLQPPCSASSCKSASACLEPPLLLPATKNQHLQMLRRSARNKQVCNTLLL
jgi:hypothetical protein